MVRSHGPIRNTLWKRVNEVEAVPFYFCVGLKLCRFNPFQSDVGAIEAQLDLRIPAVKRNPNHAEPMTREDLAKINMLVIDPICKYILSYRLKRMTRMHSRI